MRIINPAGAAILSLSANSHTLASAWSTVPLESKTFALQLPKPRFQRIPAGGGLHSFRHQHVGTLKSSAASEQTTLVDEFTDKSSVPDLKTSIKKSWTPTLRSEIVANDEDFIKPQPDKRLYRSIRLKNNGLQALLISDDQTDTEAAAVHLQVGHFADPPDRKGLAHFHEHMLFLGTSKYPEENEYEQFLNQNGGFSNAYTDMEDTNYYFCVSPMGDGGLESLSTTSPSSSSMSLSLRGALDRFAQFFISPLFKEEMIERELRAVDSEYANSLTSDSWRNFQFLKHVAHPDHPLHKFGCGNYNTLTNGGIIHNSADVTEDRVEELKQIPFHGGSSPRDSLKKFWNSYYHAENMKLVVLGRGSLDELQQIVEETFRDVRKNALSSSPLSVSETPELLEDIIPNAHKPQGDNMFILENSKFGVAAFSPQHGNIGIIREQIPVKERRAVKLQFLVPPKEEPALRKAMPMRLISHLLGHEAPHSLHSVLSDLGYINSLSSGSTMDTSDFGFFSLSLALTKKGYDELPFVLDLCWEWIHMVRDVADQVREDTGKDWMEAYHDELTQLSRNSFRFRENGDPTGFVSSAADVLFLQESQPHKILCGDALEAQYDRDVTRAILDRLTPENCMITVTNSDFSRIEPLNSTSSKFEGMDAQEWKVEPWYGAEFREMKMTSDLIKKWSEPPEPAVLSGGIEDLTLELPGLNKFIPNDFSLRCDDDTDDGTKFEREESNDKFPVPPSLVSETPLIRLWHKMDTKYRVPKTYFQSFIITPNIYRSPRTITSCRLFEKVLKDDLNTFAYDAAVAGNSYRISVSPSGFTLAVTGYSQKMPVLLDTLTNRILSLIYEMKEGPEKHPGLVEKYNKAMQNLLRETKNFKLDSPLDIANYNSRLLIEDRVWHIHQYIEEMEGPEATRSPLTMQECATLVEECLTSRVKVEVLSMGNVNETDARELMSVMETRLLKDARPLVDDEIPRFRSNRLPTKEEANRWFPNRSDEVSAFPVVLNDIVVNTGENNHAVEILIQAPPDHELGYVGIGLMELLSHLAYPSAFNTLRTKEQLGYIVSAHQRKTAGDSRFLCIEVQSNAALPAQLESRCEAWLETFRKELEDMSEERIEAEASAVVSQLMERDTKLSQEVGRAWGEITRTGDLIGLEKTDPPFDRLQKLAKVLTVGDDFGPTTAKEVKASLLEMFDRYFAKNSSERRAIVNHVYGQRAREIYEAQKGKDAVLSSYQDTQHFKQYLHTLPLIPYWIVKEANSKDQ